MRSQGALRIAGCIALLILATCSACGADAESATRLKRDAISGGETAPAGAWPNVAWLDNGCSGVLLAPDLIVYAAHCGASAANAWFGDQLGIQIDDTARTASVTPGAGVTNVPVSHCEIYPGWGFGDGDDIAFCLLAQDAVAPEVIAPALFGCARARLRAGKAALLVGFGRASASDAPGTKRVLELPILDIDEELQIGNQTEGTCAGDSGSPALVNLGTSDGPNWFVAGVLSSGLGGEDCGLGYYTDLARVLPWLEKITGRNLSSCFASDGTSIATSQCRQAALDVQGDPLAAPAPSASPQAVCADASDSDPGCTFVASATGRAEWGGAAASLVLCAALCRLRGRSARQAARAPHC